jgi:hypothetical protein
MGWLGNARTTTVQQNTTPAWVQNAVQEGIQAGRDAAARPFVPYTAPRVAGMDPMQVQARAMASANAGAWQDGLQQAGLSGMAGLAPVRDVTAPTVQAQTVQAPTMAPTAQATAVGQAAVQGVTAPTAAAGMAAYQNPYQNQVIDAAMRQVRRQADQAQAQLGQRAAAANAFGGSREAILRGEIERNAQETAGDVAGRLAAQGFDTAAGLAMQDAGRSLQAGLFSAGAANQAAEAAAGRSQQAGLFNAEAANAQEARRAAMEMEARRTTADMAMDADRTNAGFSMAAQGANQDADAAARDRAIRVGGLFGDLAETGGRLNLSDIAMLQGLGAEGRGIDQQSLDARFNEFLREQEYGDERTRLLLSAIYGAPMSLWSTRTENSTSRDPARDLQAIGSLMQGAGLFFSDRRLKRAVTPIGVDERGVAWYEYAYKWDAPEVRRVGVMAQDLLLIAPQCVQELGGVLAVDYGALHGWRR